MRVFAYICLLALLTFAETEVSAQQQTSSAKIENEIKSESAKLTSLKSVFEQTKHISGMEMDLKSQGNFYYKKNGKVKFEYTSPTKYNMTINNGNITMGEKTIKVKSSMTEMLTMMESCMTGDMTPLKTKYTLDYADKGTFYRVTVTPKTKNNFVDTIELDITKTDKMVTRVKISEPQNAKNGKDYTEYKFSKIEKNKELNDNIF